MQKERCLLGCLKENKRAVNKIKCHPELDSGSHLVSVLESGEIPNHCHQTPYYIPHRNLAGQALPGRGQAVKAAVWNDSINNSGFTLIELLVVVLIIGILAAVALPQYQLAVAKSRYISLKAVVDKITQAQEVYYLANGEYSNRFEELDIDLPAGGQPDSTSANVYNYNWGRCLTGYSGSVARTICYNTKAGFGYMRTTDRSGGLRKCAVLSSDVTDWRNQVCKQETHATSGGLSEGILWWNY